MAHNYELVLDVLNGCKWNCPGCTVDRNSKNSFTLERLEELRNLMLEEKDKGSSLTHFEIGPVDFLSCSNFEDVMETGAAKDLVEAFEYVFLTSTLLSRGDIESRLDYTAEKFAGKKVYLFIPLELRRLKEKRFGENLFSNLELFREKARGKFTLSKVYANALDIPYFSGLEYQEKLSLVRFMANDLGMKINFNYRLTSEESPQHYSYVSSSEFLPVLLKEVRELDALYEDINLPDLLLDNKPRRGLLFKDDELYWMPYLGKFTASVEPNFAVDFGKGKMEAVDFFETKLNSSQIAYLPKTSLCQNCDLMEVCLSRGILESMRVYKHFDCVVPEQRKELWRRLGAKR